MSCCTRIARSAARHSIWCCRPAPPEAPRRSRRATTSGCRGGYRDHSRMPAIDIGRDPAHEAAQRELDKPIYPKGSVAQRVHEWIHELLYRLVEKGSSLPGGWFTVSVLITLLVVAIVVAIRIAQRTIRTRRGGDYQVFDGSQVTAAQARAIAEQFAAEENWTAAIRHRLRAGARSLEAGGAREPGARRTASAL